MFTADRRRKEPRTVSRPGDAPRPRATTSFVGAVTAAAGFVDPGEVDASEPATTPAGAEAAPAAPAPAARPGFLSGGFASFLSQVTGHADYRATPSPADVIPTAAAPELAAPTPVVVVVQPTDEESTRE